MTPLEQALREAVAIVNDPGINVSAKGMTARGLLQEHGNKLLSLVGGWRPIDTAPKDGTRILLGYFPKPAYEGASTGSAHEVAFWHDTEKKWCGRVLLNAEGHFSPTHWMPLPAPPQEDDDG